MEQQFENCPVCQQAMPAKGIEEHIGPLDMECGQPDEEYYGNFSDADVDEAKGHLKAVVKLLGYNGTLEMLSNLLRQDPLAVQSHQMWAKVVKAVAESMYVEGFV